jgi:hypothetical protein
MRCDSQGATSPRTGNAYQEEEEGIEGDGADDFRESSITSVHGETLHSVARRSPSGPIVAIAATVRSSVLSVRQPVLVAPRTGWHYNNNYIIIIKDQLVK